MLLIGNFVHVHVDDQFFEGFGTVDMLESNLFEWWLGNTEIMVG